MAVKVTERKRKAFESKIKGANKVEIKITVARNDEEARIRSPGDSEFAMRPGATSISSTPRNSP